MKKLLLFILILSYGYSHAQNSCGTDEYHQQQIKNNSSTLKLRQEFEKNVKQLKPVRKSGTVRIIPVVFHIIHNGGSNNISDAQIFDAINILNQDFRRLNADAANTRDIFKGVAADMEIEFRLAQKDPKGNSTNGILRVFSNKTANSNDSIKKLSYWPSTMYLNIWVVDGITSFPPNIVGVGFMGYTQYPWVKSPETDGVLTIHNGVGSIGTSNPRNTHFLTHEVGHWLGCLHTFDNGCNGGDSVADTPPCEKRFSILNCDFTRNTCSTDNPDLPDQIENYMDFTASTCQNMFTIGQKARMNTTLQSWRKNISSQQNLIATGTATSSPSTFDIIENFSVFPNPNKGSFSVNFKLKNNSTVKATLTDALGREIHTIAQGKYGSGEHSLSIATKDIKLESGVYYINFFCNGSVSHKKIIITTL